MAFNMIGGEVQSISHVLPVGDQSRHVIVHGQVGIPVHLPSHMTQIPPPGEVGIPEVPEIKGFRGCDDEEISHPRIIIHEPIGRSWEKDPVIPSTSGVMVFLRRGRKHHPDRTVGVNVEDPNEGALGNPVVDPGPLTSLKNRLIASIQPNPGFERIHLVVLGSGRGRDQA